MFQASISRHQGWTLIEILMVVLILAIASAIVLPEFGKHDDLNVASAARELVSDLACAQSRAIAGGKNIYVRFDVAGGKYQLLDSIDPPHLLMPHQSQMRCEVELGTGPLVNVRIGSADFDGHDTLAFDGAGMPYSVSWPAGKSTPLKAGSIVLCSGGQSKVVSIQPVSGQIKVR